MNPFVKSLLTSIGAAVLPGLDLAVQSVHPTGGFANAMNSNAAYAMLYGAGLIFTHNLITQIEAQLGIHPAQVNPPLQGGSN